MELCYETERLALRLLREDYAEPALYFYEKNREVFEAWEPDRPMFFYTRKFQASLLRAEFQMALKGNALRFWIFEKGNPWDIIGTVSFQNIIRSVYQTCQIGYKLDEDFWHRGYAREAIARTLSVALYELDLHRVEALGLPENLSSIRLLQALGFEEEGICQSCIYLHGSWADHLRYSYLRP